MDDADSDAHERSGTGISAQRESVAHAIGRDADLAEGEFIAAEIDGREIAVCRVDGTLYAVSLRCTHAAWSMRNGPLLGRELACDLHGARFDVRDGCPTGGPARRPLDTYAVRVRGGMIEVDLPSRPDPPQTLAGSGGAA